MFRLGHCQLGIGVIGSIALANLSSEFRLKAIPAGPKTSKNMMDACANVLTHIFTPHTFSSFYFHPPPLSGSSSQGSYTLLDHSTV